MKVFHIKLLICDVNKCFDQIKLPTTLHMCSASCQKIMFLKNLQVLLGHALLDIFKLCQEVGSTFLYDQDSDPKAVIWEVRRGAGIRIRIRNTATKNCDPYFSSFSGNTRRFLFKESFSGPPPVIVLRKPELVFTYLPQ